METLTCQKCQSQWDRPLTRGRKPRFCEECLKTMVTSFDSTKSTSSTFSQVAYRFPGPTYWKCSSCKAEMSTSLNLDYQPAHKCSAKLKSFIPLELVRK
jgi:hypothetical protein